jgi:stage II sporulation protein D
VDCFAEQKLSSANVVTAQGWGGKDGELVLSIPGKIERRFHGRLRVSNQGGELVAIVQMDRDVAVAASLAAEYVRDTPIEALKAAAVMARSYYAGPKRHTNFDFCDTTHCQFHREPPPGSHPAWEAVQATRGMLLMYAGKPFQPLYSASCGGRTRTARESGFTEDDYPYFAVDCAICQRRGILWAEHLSRADGDALLKGPREKARLALNRRLGSGTIPGNNFTLKPDRDGYVVSGRGEGHGVGLCQRGSAGMAAAGTAFREILEHYLPNTAICNYLGNASETCSAVSAP